MIRKKPAPHLMRGVKRFSEKIMPKQTRSAGTYRDARSAQVPSGIPTPFIAQEMSKSARLTRHLRILPVS
jgi:hypothetical protein